MDAVIFTESLTKRYGRHRGITDLTLAVRSGEVFGYLGPNGAGKTTTIRLFLDFIRPTAGAATLFGMDAHRQSVAIRRRSGIAYEGAIGTAAKVGPTVASVIARADGRPSSMSSRIASQLEGVGQQISDYRVPAQGQDRVPCDRDGLLNAPDGDAARGQPSYTCASAFSTTLPHPVPAGPTPLSGLIGH